MKSNSRNSLCLPFKRLLVGSAFVSDANGTQGQTFRKVSKTRAIRLLESGRGDTARPVEFSRSHACLFGANQAPIGQ